MGIKLLMEGQYDQYRLLQASGPFDLKTSSWIHTAENICSPGGALFCDFRYHTFFIYHNVTDSYYTASGFRGCLKV